MTLEKIGESLLNDGTAYVLFVIFLEFVIGNSPSVGTIIRTFFRLSFGGTALVCTLIMFLSIFEHYGDV